MRLAQVDVEACKDPRHVYVHGILGFPPRLILVKARAKALDLHARTSLGLNVLDEHALAVHVVTSVPLRLCPSDAALTPGPTTLARTLKLRMLSRPMMTFSSAHLRRPPAIAADSAA